MQGFCMSGKQAATDCDKVITVANGKIWNGAEP